MADPIFLLIVLSACTAGAAKYFSMKGDALLAAVNTTAAVLLALIAVVKPI